MSHGCRTKLYTAAYEVKWYNWYFFHSTLPHTRSISLKIVHEWSQKSDRTSGEINDHVDKYKVSSNKNQNCFIVLTKWLGWSFKMVRSFVFVTRVIGYCGWIKNCLEDPEWHADNHQVFRMLRPRWMRDCHPPAVLRNNGVMDGLSCWQFSNLLLFVSVLVVDEYF